MLILLVTTAVEAAANVGNSRSLNAGLPLAFEQNRGQLDETVQYVVRSATTDVFFLSDRTRIVTRSTRGASVVDMRFTQQPRTLTDVEADGLLERRSSYFRDSLQNAIVDVPNFSNVTYRSVYSGVDLVFYDRDGHLEYDFIVAPHANPDPIRLAFDGAKRIEISADGDLVLQSETEPLTFRRPVAYQSIDGAQHAVTARYALTTDGTVAFELGPYDRSQALVIDPLLTLSTNLWGNVAGVAVDSARNIYVAGHTATAGLAATNGYQTQLAGSQDAYVLKLNPAGTSVIYATYLGARRVATTATAIAVDATGSAYVSGTSASGFPITPGAYASVGSTYVTKLNAAGNGLIYSTYVTSPVASLAVDATGNVFMTGTASALSTTAGAFQRTKTGATAPYVAKLSPSGSSMVYATYIGGSGNDEGKRIAVDGAGRAYVVGTARSIDFPLQTPLMASLSGTTDAFVAKLDASGSALAYSTYLGGSGNERGFGIAVDGAGQAYVTGWTNSTNFPVTSNAFQRTIGYADPSVSNAFVTKLNAAGNAIVFSSYLGGKWCLAPGVFQCFGIFDPDEGIDVGTSIAVDALGYVYVGGYATSTLFPLVDSVQAVSPPNADVWHVPFVVKITAEGDRLLYSTVVGTKIQNGGAAQIAVDAVGAAIVAGNVPSEYFPLTAGGVMGAGNGFLFKVDPGKAATSVTSSSNPVSFTQSITLTATALNPAPGSMIVFKDGAATLGTSAPTNGRATLTVNLAPGVHRITATNDRDNLVSPPYFQAVSGQ
jgi:hypothetical protein